MKEDEIEHYTADRDEAGNGEEITNTHEPEKTETQVTKIWDDSENQEIERPETITLKLLANNVEYASFDIGPDYEDEDIEAYKTTFEAVDEDTWTLKVENLPKYVDGVEQTYTWLEEIPDGYTISDYNADETGATITNTYDTERFCLAILKVWDDGNDQDGLRKAITVKLGKPDAETGYQVVNTYTLDESNGWSAMELGLPIYENGKEIEYTWAEKALEGYTIDGATEQTIDGDEYWLVPADLTTRITTLTNTHTPETTKLTVKKVWDDADNQDGIRPEKVTVLLLANGEPYAKATFADTYTFEDLPVNKNGEDIEYTIEEINVPEGYEVEIVESAEEGIDWEITNTHTPEDTEVSAKKVWNDNHNQDGKRDSVTLVLAGTYTVDGEEKTVQIEGYEWTRVIEDLTADETEVTWTNLPTIVEGAKVTYTVTEEGADSGEIELNGATYQVTVFGNASSGFIVTNSYNTETTEIPVDKTWKDNNDEDGLRPTSVVVRLYADGDEVRNAAITEADGWTYTFKDLPKYKDGTEIVYTISEDPVEGYDTNIDGYSITNTHEHETVNAKVSKIWVGDSAENRPDSITAMLLANNVETGKTVELNAGNGWKDGIDGLDKYEDGDLIAYSWMEDTSKLANGYSLTNITTSVSSGAVTVFTTELENTYNPEKTSATVVKIWDDHGDAEGFRPTSIKVTLWQNDTTKVEDHTLTAAENWMYTVADLDKYDKNGREYEYTWTEEKVTGYDDPVYEQTGTATVITNTRTPETVEISVAKSWNDSNDADHLRPTSVTVRLFANDELIAAASVNRADSWSYYFSNLPKYMNRTEIRYRIEEDEVPGYTSVISGNAASGYTVTNTHEVKTTEATITKLWENDDAEASRRPASVIFELRDSANQVIATITLSDATGWTYTKTGLPMYDEQGSLITYTWFEKVTAEMIEAGYSISDIKTERETKKGVDTFITTITNTQSTRRYCLTVTKAWDDDNNRDGKRPTEITVGLFTASGDAAYDKDGKHEWTLNASNNWTAVALGVEKYDEQGDEIQYVWKEISVPDGYAHDPDSDVDTEGCVTILTNHYVPETVESSVEKIWDDMEDKDRKRPESVTVRLSNGDTYVLPYTGSDANVEVSKGGWKITVKNLPKYAHGEEIKYFWSEDPVNGYAMTSLEISGNDTVITNSYTPGKVLKSGLKTWVDEDDLDELRPDSITIHLLADGVDTGKSLTVTSDTNWTWTFTDLDQYNADGDEIVYTVTEDEVIDYTTTYDGMNVKNTHVPEKTEQSIKKNWDDSDNQDGIRPDSVAVTLYADGVAVTTVVLSEENGWSYTVNDLPLNKKGKQIEYTWSETVVPMGYTESQEDGVITNTHETETTKATVRKVWDDNDDNSHLRPVSLTVTLSNGDSYVLTADNDWSQTVEDLPKYSDGELIFYSWTETVPDGYKQTGVVMNYGSDGFVTEITNTVEEKTTESTVSKIWDDADDQDGKRPAILKVTLTGTADGGTETYELGTYDLSAANGWSLTIRDLPAYINGSEIIYSWTEEVPEGYTQDSVSVEGANTTFTNSYTPETTEASVQKLWNDDDNRDGKRPASVTVRLLCNNEKTDITATLSDDNGWSHTETGLPAYTDRSRNVYSWIEESVSEDYSMSGLSISGTITTITNKYTPGRTSLVVLKNWEDNNDQDGIRPTSITVTLYANDTATDTTVTLSAANHWIAIVNDLPVNDGGSAISYSWKEEGVPTGYITTSETSGQITVITNTYTPEVTSVPVTKIWADNNNSNGERPESIIVELLADGQPVRQMTITAADGWVGTFEELPVKANGSTITYTVREIEVPANYTASVSDTTITNTYTPPTTGVAVVKIWDDQNDSDGMRPDQIRVTLYGDDEAVDSVILSEENGWTATVDGLPVTRNGNKIAYTWTEDNVDDYTMSSYNTVGIVTTITNKHTPKETSTVVQKVWTGNMEHPDSIVVLLLADGETIGSETLNASNGWTARRTGLPEAKDGHRIFYTWKEASVPEGYVANISVNGNVTTITNTAQTGILTVTKAVTGVETNMEFSFTVRNAKGQYLAADGTLREGQIVHTLRSGETFTFNDVPYGFYIVTELGTEQGGAAQIEGHYLVATQSGSGLVAAGLDGSITLHNDYTPVTGGLVVVKTISGANVNRSYYIAVSKDGLYYDTDGNASTSPVWVTVGVNTPVVWTNLPEGTYTVTEDPDRTAVDGYVWNSEISVSSGTVALNQGNTGSIVLNNVYDEPGTGSLIIIKTFHGVEDVNPNALAGLTFRVTGPDGYDQTFYYAQFTGGTYTITGLKPGTYDVVETNADGLLTGYKLVASTKSGSGIVTVEAAGSFSFDNTYEPEEVPGDKELVIVKLFSGVPEGADVSNLRFKVTNDATGETIATLSYAEFTNGQYTLTGLDEGTYTVTELNADRLIAGYTLSAVSVTNASVTVAGHTVVNLVNIYEPEEGGLTLIKTFVGVPEGANVDALNFRITGPNGYVANVSYASFTNGSYTITGLPVGTYTVTETNANKLIANYTLTAGSITMGSSAVTAGRNATVNLKNIYEPQYGSLTIVKTFSGLLDTDDPSYLTFRILGPNGFDQTVLYKDFTNGSYTLDHLTPGQYVVYETNADFLSFSLTLLRTSVTAAQGVVVTGENTTVNLVNDYANANTGVMVMKIWDDMNNLDGTRPESIVMTLSNGTSTVTTVTLNEANNWVGEVNGIPVADAHGNPITYTWTEETVTGYTMTSKQTMGNVTVFTNSHTPEYTSVTVKKVWNDYDNAAGRRPAILRVKLSNGTDYYLCQDNEWTVTVTDLPKYLNGELVTYTWSEQSVVGYTQSSVVTEGDVTIFTNTYITTPPGPRPPVVEPLNVEVIINHVGDCFD